MHAIFVSSHPQPIHLLPFLVFLIPKGYSKVKKLSSILYCSVFFLLISMPLVLMPMANNQPTENRLLAPIPELFKNGSFNLSAPIETEEYFRDHFAGRTQMIDAYSRLVGSLFTVSANDRVIMGRDGFLFFHETIGDYDGSAALSDFEMEGLIRELIEIKQAAQLREQLLLIAVAPNKNTLYGEYMPQRYAKTNEPTNLDRLLAVEELDFIDLHAALLGAGQTVYYKTDSHWNALGARIAAREIIAAIEEKTGVKTTFDWDSAAFDDAFIVGDLGRMLYPANPPREESRFYEDARQSYSTIGRFRSLDDLRITTESDAAPLRIAIYRDSFAEALIPYISNAFSNVYYTRQTPPPLDSTEFLQADVIVLQIAERRISELIGIGG